ncbi:putative leader peptide [Pseudonocardia oroxyli]
MAPRRLDIVITARLTRRRHVDLCRITSCGCR